MAYLLSIHIGLTDSQSISALQKGNIGIAHLMLGVPAICWVRKAMPQHLPSGLFLFPNFVTLIIGECRGLQEWFRRFEGSHSTCPKLETLHFQGVNLSNKDVHAIVYNFRNLKYLNVSGSIFVSLPSYIKESIKLTTLDASFRVNLREIPELLSSVESRSKWMPFLNPQDIKHVIISGLPALYMMQSYPPRALDRRLQEDWAKDARESPRVLMSLRVDFRPMG